MQEKCDLYLCGKVKTDRLKFVRIFDNQFFYDQEKTYSGYLNINVDRIKLVSVVSDLRKNNVDCFSVPIAYRDQANISSEAALRLANEYSKSIEASAVESIMRGQISPPVYWIFDLIYNKTENENAGGIVMIDRVDGHVWTGSEYEEYMYDYNNIL